MNFFSSDSIILFFFFFQNLNIYSNKLSVASKKYYVCTDLGPLLLQLQEW